MATSATAGGPGAHGMQAGEAAYGLCYGTKTSHPRTPAEVVEIYRSHGIAKMWLSPTPLSPTNEAVISVLDIIMDDSDLRSKMKIFLYIENNDFSLLADNDEAKKWVDIYIAKFASIISYVCVGDVLGCVDFTSSIFQEAMSNLKKLLSDPIKLSTIVKPSILLGDSYTTKTRPSSCRLAVRREDLLQFESLFVRIMPYFWIKPDNISIDNCILKEGASVYMHDMVDKDYSYSQAFEAILDSICFAMKKDCPDGLGKMNIHVVSGWPTVGPTDWASKKYAKQYISNLVQHIGVPTPMGNKPVDIFIYSMVDEDNLETFEQEFKHLGAERYLPRG